MPDFAGLIPVDRVTFSKAMNPSTITGPGTFTVAVSGVGGAAVAGVVTYNAVTNVATFTPNASLTGTTQYTATITNAAKDLAGNALAAGSTPNPWTFTTGASVGPTGPNLGSASTFGAFGGAAGITNQGINTIINGNIGTTGADTLITGFHDDEIRRRLDQYGVFEQATVSRPRRNSEMAQIQGF